MATAVTVFDRALRCIVARDLDGYLDGFAPEGVVEWPFAPPGWPRRLEGHDAIRAHLGANLARSRAAGRRMTAPHDLIVHEVAADCVVAEFTVEVHAADGSCQRLPYVHVIALDAAGRIASLRDYFGATTVRIAQASAPLARRLYAALDAQDWAQVEGLLAPDLEVRHGGGAPIDAAAWRARLEAIYRAIPDGHHVIDDVLVEADRAVTRARFVGTHTGGAAATGEAVEITVVHIDRFEHGLLREHFGQADHRALPAAFR